MLCFLLAACRQVLEHLQRCTGLCHGRPRPLPPRAAEAGGQGAEVTPDLQ